MHYCFASHTSAVLSCSARSMVKRMAIIYRSRPSANRLVWEGVIYVYQLDVNMNMLCIHIPYTYTIFEYHTTHNITTYNFQSSSVCGVSVYMHMVYRYTCIFILSSLCSRFQLLARVSLAAAGIGSAFPRSPNNATPRLISTHMHILTYTTIQSDRHTESDDLV